MHIFHHATSMPTKAATIMARTGETTTFAELEARSNQAAHLFRQHGLGPQDVVAVVLDNNRWFFEIAWAAQRAGLFYACLSTKLTPNEALYILRDCGAKLLLIADAFAPLAEALALAAPDLPQIRVGDGPNEFAAHTARLPATPIADELSGADLLYSSGTTGRPKGVKVNMAAVGQAIDADNPLRLLASIFCGIDQNTVYLCPAPLYHAAPLRWSITVQKVGGTVVLMENFDPEEFLALIERHRVTHVQVVPTMFVRLLKLPAEVRARYDVSSLRCCFHAAAPCPVEIKRQMLDWLGPIVHEYYAGSEGNGLTWIGPEDWLAHPGSVGRAVLGELHILREDGAAAAPGETGMIYFANGPAFEYHNDPDKTAEARSAAGWTTLGDVGHLDADGYLYLTDRKAFMIISGGVNVYPQEVENVLITHPKVADVAVFGVPDADFGEAVKAVVQPVNWADADANTAEELIAFCRSALSPIKCPKSIDFDPELPRMPTGKLFKRLLRDRYWSQT